MVSERSAGSLADSSHFAASQRKLRTRTLEEDANKKQKETCGFCCVFFLFLAAIPIMFFFSYHAYPTTVLSCTALLMGTSFLPLMYHRGDIVTSEPVGPLLTATMLASSCWIFLAVLRCYYEHIYPMRELVLGRQYNGVFPQFPGIAFGDAAYIDFASGTEIDKSKSLGMKSLQSGLNTFCVAPVINMAETGRIGFWAIGADCCGDDGTDFTCEDASDASAHSAWVLREPADALYGLLGRHIVSPMVRRDIFERAVNQSEQVHSLSSGDDPILVRWTKESKDDLIWREFRTVLLSLFIVALCAAGFAMLLTRINTRFNELRHAQVLKKTGKNPNSDVSALFTDFFRSVEEEFEELEHHAGNFRPRLSRMDSCLFGVVIPFVVFLSCIVLASYSACLSSGLYLTAMCSCLITTLILSLLSTKNRVINGLCIMLCALAGLHIGIVNYENNMYQYCSVQGARSYSDVMPDANSEEYTDAGKISFASSSHLSQNLSVGFLYQSVTYCVAPILSQKAPCLANMGQPVQTEDSTEATSNSTGNSTLLLEWKPRFLHKASRMHKSARISNEDQLVGAMVDDVEAATKGIPYHAISELQSTAVTSGTGCDEQIEFWATGVDCCDSRGYFTCDDAEDDSAKSAIVVHPFRSYMPTLCRKMYFPEVICESIDVTRDGSLSGSRQQLLNAVDQSVAANGLRTPEHIVFIRWGKNADDLQKTYSTRSFGIVTITSLIALVVMSAASALDYFYLSAERKDEEKWVKEHEKHEEKMPVFPMRNYFLQARDAMGV